MHEDWQIEARPDGTGLIERRAEPRLRAQWCTGFEDLAVVEGLCWTVAGANEADTITLHAIRFADAPPDQAAFEALMREAVIAIDHWIAQRL